MAAEAAQTRGIPDGESDGIGDAGTKEAPTSTMQLICTGPGLAAGATHTMQQAAMCFVDQGAKRGTNTDNDLASECKLTPAPGGAPMHGRGRAFPQRTAMGGRQGRTTNGHIHHLKRTLQNLTSQRSQPKEMQLPRETGPCHNGRISAIRCKMPPRSLPEGTQCAHPSNGEGISSGVAGNEEWGILDGESDGTAEAVRKQGHHISHLSLSCA